MGSDTGSDGSGDSLSSDDGGDIEAGWESSSSDKYWASDGSDSAEDGGKWTEATDTSDEEEIRNTKGNIPLEWYDELPHFGYDIEGKKIPKPASSDRDEVRPYPEYLSCMITLLLTCSWMNFWLKWTTLITGAPSRTG